MIRFRVSDTVDKDVQRALQRVTLGCKTGNRIAQFGARNCGHFLHADNPGRAFDLDLGVKPANAA